MSDNGKAIAHELAQEIAPFEIRILYHPVTHQVQCQMPQCDDIIRYGMLEFAKAILLDARSKANPIATPNFLIKPGQRLT